MQNLIFQRTRVRGLHIPHIRHAASTICNVWQIVGNSRKFSILFLFSKCHQQEKQGACFRCTNPLNPISDAAKTFQARFCPVACRLSLRKKIAHTRQQLLFAPQSWEMETWGFFLFFAPQTLFETPLSRMERGGRSNKRDEKRITPGHSLREVTQYVVS